MQQRFGTRARLQRSWPSTVRNVLQRTALFAAFGSVLSACSKDDAIGSSSTTGGTSSPTVAVEFERYELSNGLDVILHVDRSDPIAAVAMTFHVGSAREVAGKTGFAHLFEHLFFLDSENLGPGGLDKLMTRVGSSTNGSTSNDRTNYFETVPIDGLQKALWAEADKLGFFINTVTESVVAKEKQVVKNEKRQSVDNQPYGHNDYVIDNALYPEGHPYKWQVIGSLADLESATLADVKEFHSRWYGPNNATLVVSGDINVAETKAWIEKYFGEIPSATMPAAPTPPAVALASTPRLMHEDNLARVPMLTLAWPTVPVYHPDQYALDVLAQLLTDGKSAPFYKVLVEETKVAPSVNAGQFNGELAGRWDLSVRAFAETDLDSVALAIDTAFARFEREGVIATELQRVKAGYERAFYASLSSVIGKAFQLAQYNIFAKDPGFAQEDLRRTLAVSEADVKRVYEQYIKGKHHVITSFVPKGQSPLALDGSARASVVEEPIVIGAEAEIGEIVRGTERTTSSFDRSVEPPFGTSPSLKAPNVWRTELANGMPVFGIEDREVPLVQFEFSVRGGQLVESPNRVGVANLLAESMTAGTAKRTPAELEKAIDMLGASINVSADGQRFNIRGSTLARNYDSTMAIVREILLEPRYDSAEFVLSQQRVANQLRQLAANPVAIAGNVFRRQLYEGHILAQNPLGDLSTVESITLSDLRAYHETALKPSSAAFHVTGAVSQAQVETSLEGIAAAWTGTAPAMPAAPTWSPDRAGLYFVDVPNASQSVLRIGYPALAVTNEEYYPAVVMNFRLGGGGFASELTQVLREQRGYTYGINSSFNGTDIPGPFQIGSSVRANVTLEALQAIKQIVERHGPDFDDADLEETRSFLLRSNAGAFETGGAKLGLLSDMSAFGFPADYVLQREKIVRDMDVPRIQALSQRYLDPSRMIWLVVGDARTQLPRLRALGLGEPILLDRDGQRVK
jgi:zinc protease